MAAAGAEIPNLGCLQPEMVVESGQAAKMVFQAAKVRKPLLAVSACNEKGNPVIFDGENSFIIPGGSSDLARVRELVAEIPNKIKLHQQNGVYKLRAWVKPKDPFHGPGW